MKKVFLFITCCLVALTMSVTAKAAESSDLGMTDEELLEQYEIEMQQIEHRYYVNGNSLSDEDEARLRELESLYADLNEKLSLDSSASEYDINALNELAKDALRDESTQKINNNERIKVSESVYRIVSSFEDVDNYLEVNPDIKDYVSPEELAEKAAHILALLDGDSEYETEKLSISKKDGMNGKIPLVGSDESIIIVNVKPGLFSKGKGWIVISGVDENGFRVAVDERMRTLLKTDEKYYLCPFGAGLHLAEDRYMYYNIDWSSAICISREG